MMIIRDMLDTDWDTVRQIYIEGIDTGNATFQTEAPSFEDWDKGHMRECRLVAVNDQKLLGWLALSKVSGRCVYAGVVEVSVYIAKENRGMQVGSQLFKEMIPLTENLNIWTIQAGIFPENTGSIRLHTNFGFKILGTREKIGKLHGQWRDVLLLERRSKKVGID